MEFLYYLFAALVQAIMAVRWFDRHERNRHDRLGMFGVFLFVIFAPLLTIFLCGYIIFHLIDFALNVGRNDRRI